MSTSNDDQYFGCLWVITIVISLGSGVLAWQWMNPKSFLGGVGFLLLWGLFSYIIHIVLGMIAMAFMDNNK